MKRIRNQYKFPIGPAPLYFYRYYSFYDQVSLERCKLIRQTPAGCWIDCGLYCKDRWVSNNSTRRYAYPTKELAMNSFIARKNRQILILNAQLERAKSDLRWAKTGSRNEPFKIPGLGIGDGEML